MAARSSKGKSKGAGSRAAAAKAKTDSKPANRRGLSKEAMQKSKVTKKRKRLFDRYVMQLNGTPVKRGGGKQLRKWQAELQSIDDALDSGKKTVKAPNYIDGPDGKKVPETDDNGKRIMVEKQTALRPSDRLSMLSRRTDLQALIEKAEKGGKKAPGDLRSTVLDFLPEYAADQGFTVRMLQTVGVPDADLIECGMMTDDASDDDASDDDASDDDDASA